MVPMFFWSGVLALVRMPHAGTQEQFDFEHDNALSGVRCSAAANSVGVVRSKIMCAGACKKDVGCKAFFHDVASGECFTYGTVPTSVAGCSVRPGAFFKKPGGDFGDACASNAGCTMSGMECKDSTCQCAIPLRYDPGSGMCVTPLTAGGVFGGVCASNAGCTMSGMECKDSTCQCADPLRYDPGSGMCVTQCNTYGNTYTWRLLTERGNTVDLKTILVTTPSKCMNRCSSTSACTGVKYWLGWCVLQQETAASYTRVGVSDWYSRNCI